MADFTDKVQEAVGEVKQTAGDLTGNDDLKAEGVADTAKANLKQGVDAVADKAGDAVEGAQRQLSDLADTTADAARQLHLDEAASTLADTRVVIGAAVAAVVIAIVVGRRRRASRNRRSTAKRAAVAGIGRALSR